MTNDTTAVTTMAPLLLLVVTQLGSVGRETDLCAAVRQQRPPLGLPFLKFIFPPLGRVNLVHGGNLVVLNVGLILVFALSGGWIEIAMGIAILGVFVMQPVLEVDEYSKILNPKNGANLLPHLYSFHVHVVFAFAIAGYGFYYSPNLTESASGSFCKEAPPIGWGCLEEVAPFFVPLLLLNLVAYLCFTWLLHEELVAVNGNSHFRVGSMLHRMRDRFSE